MNANMNERLYTYDSKPAATSARNELYVDHKGNYYVVDKHGLPIRLTAVKSVTPSFPQTPDVGDHTGISFDDAYERIMIENWGAVSPHAILTSMTIPRGNEASYRMWDVEVVVGHPVKGIFDHMQPTLGKAYTGSMGRFGICITLENGRSLCLRDGEFDTVRIVRPRFCY